MKHTTKKQRSLLPTVFGAAGMLVGGLLGLACSKFRVGETAVIIFYGVGAVIGFAAGAVIGYRWLARIGRGGKPEDGH